MTAPDPLVSVVIAAYNAGRFLAETLESVMAQDHGSIEVVVIDDGSTDDTAEAIASFGAAVVTAHQDNAGLGAAQNHGIRLATGTHLSFVDADDLWAPHKTSLQLAALEEHDDAEILFGLVEQFGTEGPGEDAPPSVDESRRILPGYSTGTMLLRRDDFDRVGPFAETITIGPFIDWYARATELGLRPLVADEVVMRRRIHDENMGRRLKGQRGDYLKVLKRSIDRRRDQAATVGGSGSDPGGSA